MGYLVRAYYIISPTWYYKDDSWWSADLKSNEKQILENFDMARNQSPLKTSSAVEASWKLLFLITMYLLGKYCCVVTMVREDGISVPYQQLCCGEPKGTKEDDDSQNCPRGEIKKLEIELWNLKVKGTDVASYTLHFQELALMCGRMFHEESYEFKKYVGGLPDMIRGNVMSYQPKTMKKAIEFANDQMDQKVLTIAERHAKQKRKGSTRDHYPCVQNATITTKGHVLPCVISARRSAIWLVTVGVLVPMGHFKRDCPKLENKNRGNQGGNGNAPAKVYVEGNAGINPDSNVVTGTFLLNNCYASILFDIGADRSFISTTFSSLIDITPTTLDHYYDVELADEKIIGINTIIRGCTLNFLDHPFNINLMPIELGSFDVIVGTDWLAKYHTIIDCAEKIVRIPWGNETLIVHGDESSQGNGTRLNIIPCTKTHKYLLKGRARSSSVCVVGCECESHTFAIDVRWRGGVVVGSEWCGGKAGEVVGMSWVAGGLLRWWASGVWRGSHSPSSSALQSLSLHQGVVVDSTLMEDNPFAPVDNHPFINVFAPEPSSKASSFGDLSSAEYPYVSQTLHHLRK
ncbi:putative reverse transcriptase domain-containing protein [Tanacetum coccineum]